MFPDDNGSGGSLEGPVIKPVVSPGVVSNKNSLEDNNTLSSSQSAQLKQNYSFLLRFNRAAFSITGGVLALLLVVGLGILLLTGHNKPLNTDNSLNTAKNYAVGNLKVNNLSASNQALLLGKVSSLQINGQLQVSQGLVLTPTTTPTTATAGLIYYSQTNNQPYYYNGSQYISLTPTPLPQHVSAIGGVSGNISVGNGLQVTNSQLSVSSSLVNQVNSTVLGTGTIGEIGRYIGSNTLGASALTQTGSLVSLTGDLNVSGSISAGSLTVNAISSSGNNDLSLNSGGNIEFTADGRNFIFPTSGITNQTICTTGVTCAAGGGLAVQLQPGSAQTDNGSGSSIFINNTGGGNLIELQSGATDKFTINNSGAVSAAGSLQSASFGLDDGDFTLDSSGNVITIGGVNVEGASGVTVGAAGITSGSLVFANATNSHLTTLQGLAPSGQNQTITVPASDAANDTVCLLTLANCVGTGGGATTSGGSVGYIPKFSSGSNLVNSNLSETGTTLDYGGNIITNTASGFSGNLINLEINGSSKLTIDQSGNSIQAGTLTVNGGGNSSIAGSLSVGNGLTISNGGASIHGSVTLNSLGAGLLQSSNSGLLSSGAVDRNSSTYFVNSLSVTNGGSGTNSFASQGILYGNGTGAVQTTSSAANAVLVTDNSSVPSLSQTLPSAVQGNIVATGSLTSGSIGNGFGVINTANNITTTAGLQSGSLTVTGGNFTVSSSGNVTTVGSLSVQGGSGLIVGVTGSTTGLISLANASNNNLTNLESLAPAGQDQTILIPATTGSSDTVCLQTLGNCVGASGAVSTISGTQDYITKYNNAGANQITNSQLYDNGTTVGIATATPNASYKLDVNGSTNVSGSLNVVNGLTSGGTITLSSLSSAGVVHNSATGVLTTGPVVLGSETSGNFVTNLGALTGLTTTGNSGAGSTPSLSVTYGNTLNSAVEGDTSLTCPSGTGNLSGGGNSITLGSGGTCGALSITNSPTFTGTLSAQGAGGISLGVAGVTAGLLQLANSSNTNLANLQALASTGSGDVTFDLPSVAGGSTQTICTVQAGNCAGSGTGITGSGTIGYIALFDTSGSHIGNSDLSQSGSTLTDSGSLVIQGSNSLSLGTNSSGASPANGSVTFNDSVGTDTVTLQAPTVDPGSNLVFSLPSSYGSNGSCLESNGAGNLSFTSCTGGAGGGVTSLDSQTGVLSLNNSSSPSSGVIQINLAKADASTLGIATFNSTNFTDNGSGTINTVQDIDSTASPTFNALNLNTVTSQGQLSVAASGSGSGVYVQGAGSGASPVAVIQSGGSSGDLLDLDNSGGIPVAKFDDSGSLTAVDASLSGNFLQTGATSFTTGSGIVTLNGNTTVSGSNTFNVAGGLASLGGGLNVSAGGETISGGSTITGAVSINASGTSNTTIGNSSGSFSISSSGLTVTTAGALSGVTSLVASGALTAAVSSNTINGLVVNAGALSNVTGINTNGGYTQTGAVANTFDGATTFSAVGTALTVSHNALISGTLSVGSSSQFGVDANGNITTSGTANIQGSGGLTLGIAGTAAGLLNLANASNTDLVILQGLAPSGTGNATIQIPTIAGGGTDTVCLETLANCVGTGGGVEGTGTAGDIAEFTSGNTIANSGLSESGSTLTYAGNTIVNAANGFSGNLLNLQVNSSSKLSVDQAGDSTQAGTLTVNGSGASSIAGSLSVGANLTVTGALNLTGSGTLPGSPTAGEVYYDTTLNQLLVYENGQWQGDTSTATEIVAASNSLDKYSANFIATGTNDQTTINNAIAALPSTGGSVVLLDGTYNIGGSITLNKSNVTLTGQGQSTILNRTFDGDAVIKANGASSINIYSLAIAGNKATYTSSSDYGILATGGGSLANANSLIINNTAGDSITGQASKITNNTITNSGGQGISNPATGSIISGNTITGSTGYALRPGNPDITISDNYISSNTGGGIYLDNNAYNDTITGNTIINNSSDGINSRNASLTIADNDISSNTYGIYIQGNFGASNQTITGNEITSNTSDGIYFSSTGAGTSNNNIIDSNYLASNGGNGITITGNDSSLAASNYVINGNQIYNTGGGGSSSGINLTTGGGTISNVSISNNMITSTAGTGYAINISAGVSGTYLSNNTYSGTGASSIENLGTGTIYADQTNSNGSIILSGPAGVGLNVTAPTDSVQSAGALVQGGLTTPSAPTVTPAGTTGSTTWGYEITAYDGQGQTLASTQTTIANGNATLNSTNYNTITPVPVYGAVSYYVYRTTAGGTPSTTGLIGTIAAGSSTLSLNDTGLSATTAAPTTNTTGQADFLGYSATFKNSTNSTTAFQVQNTAGTNIFNVNTSGQVVNIDQLSSPGIVTPTLLSTPASPSVTVHGTAGSASYTYKVSAVLSSGYTTAISAAASTATGNATLTSSNYNIVSWSAVTGAVSYNVYRTVAGGTSPTTTGLISSTAGTSINDTGLAATLTTPSASSLGSSTTYYYEVTALDGLGNETTHSTEISQATSSANQSIGLSWNAVPGARSYRVYRGTSSEGENIYFTTSTNSYTDYGTGTSTSATPPTTNTAYSDDLSSSGNSQITIGSAGTATGQLYVGGNIPPPITVTNAGTAGSTAVTYQVVGINSSGNAVSPAPYSVGSTGTANATLNSTNYNTLSWTAVNGASSYNIYRVYTGGGSPGGTGLIGNTASNTFNDTGLTASGSVPNSGAVSITSVSSNDTPITATAISGRYLYSFLGNGSTVMQVYDVSNPASPSLISSTSFTYTPNGNVVIAGHYLYFVAGGSNSDTYFVVLDISNPSAPTMVSAIQATGLTATSGGNTIAVQGNYAYTADNGAGAFQIFNISNPLAPTLVSSWGGINHANSLSIQGSYVYLSNLGGSGTIYVFNISNPLAPTLASTYSPGGTSNYVAGRYMYNLSGSSLQVYDISNPASITLLSSVNIYPGTGITGQGHYLYISTSANIAYGRGITMVYDISTPTAPLYVGALRADSGSTVDIVQGRYAYIGSNGTAGGTYVEVYDLGGEFAQNFEAGTAEVGTLAVDNNETISGNSSIQGGLNVGNSIQAAGNLGIGGSAYIQGATELAGGIQGGVTINGLSTPSTPTITPEGTAGSTNYSYAVAAVSASGGTTPASTAGTTATGNATLSGTNYNQISWTPVTGAVSYNIYRTASSGTPSTTGLIGNTSSTTFNDTGIAGTTTAPTLDTSGQLTVNAVAVFKDDTNSTTAFQVQNASSGSVLTADTANMRVGIDNTYSSLSAPASPSASAPTQSATPTVTPTGTTGATSYSYEVIANIASGQSAASVAGTTATGNATLSSTNYNALSWTAYGGATSYYIYRSSGGTTQGLIGVATTNSFNDTGLAATGSVPVSGGSLTPSQAYYYKVTAIDSAGGETSPSNEVNATTGASGTLTINVSWTASTGASGYKVYRGTTSGSEVYLSTVLTNKFTDTGTITAGTATPPSSNTAYISTNVSNNNLQLSVGGNGTPTGQLYVSGTVPTNATGSASVGNTVNSTVVRGSYAYEISESGSAYLKIYNISNPADPMLVSSTATQSWASGAAIYGNYAYVIGGPGNTGMSIYNISNPASPALISTLYTTVEIGAPIIQGHYMYASINGNGLGIFSLSNPAQPIEVGYTDNITGAVTALSVSGSHVYVGENAASNDFQIFDVSNPANPTLLGSTYVTIGPTVLATQGNYVYVIRGGGGGFQVVDVSNTTNPVVLPGVSVATAASSLVVQGRYAYIGLGAGNINVIDISNPDSPALVGVIPTSGGVNSLAVQGNYAYAGSNGLLQTFNLGGEYAQQLQAGGIETGTLQVDANATISGDELIQGGLDVGASIQTAGSLGVSGSAAIQGSTVLSGGTNLLSTPGAPTVTPTGTAGTTTYSYTIAAINAYGASTVASSAGTTTTGNATLSSSNYNALSWTAVSGATSYNIYRTVASGTSPTSTGLIGNSASTSFNDTGLVGSGSAGVSPTINTTAQLTVEGAAVFQNSTNSTTAFQVQNTAGVNIFNVNTSGQVVNIDQLSSPGIVTPTLLSAPASPTTTPHGTTGSTSYTYEVSAVLSSGYITALSAAASTSTGNATLSSSNYNRVSWSAVTGAVSYNVYRTVAGGTSPTTIGLISSGGSTSLNDTGLTATQSTPSSATLSSSATYYYKVTVLDDLGNETTPSTEISQTTSASNQSIGLSWAAVPGAQSYRVYRGTSSGGENIYFTTNTNSYTDYGTGTSTSATPPTSGTAYTDSLTNSTNAQISIGGNSNSTGQVYVGGNLAAPAAVTNGGAAGTTNYVYQISGVNAAGNVLPPPYDTGYTNTGNATLSGTNYNTISWSTIPGAVSYNVYRTVSYGTPSTGGLIANTTGTTLNDTGLSASGSAPSSAVGNLATSVGVIGIVNQGNYSYIASSTTGTAFKVIDDSNPTNPTLISTVLGTRLSGIVSEGHYIIGISSSTDTFQVYDVSNPSNPILLSTTSTNFGSGSGTAYSIAASGNYVYIGTSSYFEIFNISNPANPVLTGDVSIYSSVYLISISGSYAYIDDNFNATVIQTINISNPASPTIAETYSGTFNGAFTGFVVQGRYLYGYTSGLLQIFDASNPYNLSLISQVAPQSVSSLYTANIIVQGRYMYATSGNGNPGWYGSLQVYDISNPLQPSLISAEPLYNQYNQHYISVNGRYLYLDGNNGEFQAFDMGGTYTQSLQAGSAEVGTLQVDSNATFSGDTSVQGALTVGSNIQDAGNLGVAGSAYVQGATELAGGIQGGVTISGLSTPSTPTITPEGTAGSTNYSYAVAAVSASGGTTPASVAGSTTTGNATLSSSNYNQVAWTPVSGAVSYNIYRTVAGGTSPTTTGLIGNTSSTTFNDTGIAGTTAAPTQNTSGQLNVTGNVLFENATNSTTAFQVQNSSAGDVFDVDTTDSWVGVGTNTPGNLLSIGALTTAEGTYQIAVSTGGTTNSGIVVQTVLSQSSGYVFQAQSSTGSTLASIDYQGNLSVANAAINGTLTVNGHIVTGNTSGSTTAAVQTAAGTGGSPSCTVTGNDTAGQIVLTTGTSGWSSGAQCIITFSSSYSSAPHPVITPGSNVSTLAVNPFVTSNTTTFTLNFINADTAQNTYTWNYFNSQ